MANTAPNLVYAIFHKLNEQHIWQWHEVINFSDAYFDPKRGPEALTGYCKPAVDRFTHRYRSAMDVLRGALSTLEDAKKSGDETWRVNCERSVKQAREAKDVLDTFKKDMNSFIRFYILTIPRLQIGPFRIRIGPKWVSRRKPQR